MDYLPCIFHGTKGKIILKASGKKIQSVPHITIQTCLIKIPLLKRLQKLLFILKWSLPNPIFKLLIEV